MWENQFLVIVFSKQLDGGWEQNVHLSITSYRPIFHVGFKMPIASLKLKWKALKDTVNNKKQIEITGGANKFNFKWRQRTEGAKNILETVKAEG